VVILNAHNTLWAGETDGLKWPSDIKSDINERSGVPE
jgi:ligand-binding sensor domain-containing protein